MIFWELVFDDIVEVIVKMVLGFCFLVVVLMVGVVFLVCLGVDFEVIMRLVFFFGGIFRVILGFLVLGFLRLFLFFLLLFLMVLLL